MAVSKRLRHEVMRRDNHTCRYCGGGAPTAYGPRAKGSSDGS